MCATVKSTVSSYLHDNYLDQNYQVNGSLHCRRIFGKQTLSTSSRNLKAEKGWGEIDISTKGVVDTHPLPAHFYRNRMMTARQTIASL